jgi:TetR/AcrR family transcriptional regulator, cholesterol catabolism regulator
LPDEREYSESREQFMRVAEALFSERGYTAVTLKDIADALKVKQAAIYYHFPQGKEQLFLEVMRRSFHRQREGLEAAVASAEPKLAVQFKAMMLSMLSLPPINVTRLARSDFPALEHEANRQELYQLGQVSLTQPIKQVIDVAYRRGEIRLVDMEVMATIFLSMTDAIHEMVRYKNITKEVLAQDVLDVLLNGLHRR